MGNHSLEFLDINLFHTLFTGGPLAFFDADRAAKNFNESLNNEKGARDRNKGFKGIKRRAIGGN